MVSEYGAGDEVPQAPCAARMKTLRQVASLALSVATLGLAACSDRGGEPPCCDTVTEIRHANALGRYRSIVYVPAGVGSDAPAPLLMVLHGANTTAEQMRAFGLFDPLARREGFAVMYPDHETDGALELHPLQSWRMWDPLEMQRGAGDAGALAALTQQVLATWNIDPQRVYVVGVSAGGWMTSIMGAAYPDLYAAIGIVEAGAYGLGTALLGVGQPIVPSLLPPQLPALAAYQAMGPRARVVPMINFQGANDAAATPASGALAVRQWLMTNNLVVSGSFGAPFPLTPTQTVDVIPDGDRYPYHIDSYRDADGCRVVEQVRIDQMAHFWPGGSDDPTLAGFTDPRAPSAAELSWAFFKRFRLSETALPCVEAQ